MFDADVTDQKVFLNLCFSKNEMQQRISSHTKEVVTTGHHLNHMNYI